jgi:hypothetical protein
MKEQMMMEVSPPIHRSSHYLHNVRKKVKTKGECTETMMQVERSPRTYLQKLNGDGKRAPQTLGSIMAIDALPSHGVKPT